MTVDNPQALFSADDLAEITNHRPERPANAKPRGLPRKIPAGSFVLPHDILERLGGGDFWLGELIAAYMFNFDTHHPQLLPPAVVADIGHGNLAAGRKVLAKFVANLRKREHSRGGAIHVDDVLDLSRLPPHELRRLRWRQ